MLLFVNVFVTNQRMNEDSGDLRPDRAHNKLDVFKYTLASYESIPWSEVHLYYELDTEFLHREGEFRAFVEGLFPDNLRLFNHRISDYKGWNRALGRLPSVPEQLIWFTCNDDHVLIASDLEPLNKAVNLAKKLSADTPYVSVQITHWPEVVAAPERYRLSKLLRSPLSDSAYYKAKIKGTDLDGSTVTYHSSIGTQILTRAVLDYWFASPAVLPNDLRRTDFISFFPDELLTVFPRSEIARHFDGYSHTGVRLDVVPVLMIPDGFFEGRIKILSGGSSRIPGYVWLHPLKQMWADELLHSERPLSIPKCDLNITFDEIPYFWRNRVRDHIDASLSQSSVHRARLAQLMKELMSDSRLGYTPRTARRAVRQGLVGSRLQEASGWDLFWASRRAWSLRKRSVWIKSLFLQVLSALGRNKFLDFVRLRRLASSETPRLPV